MYIDAVATGHPVRAMVGTAVAHPACVSLRYITIKVDFISTS